MSESSGVKDPTRLSNSEAVPPTNQLRKSLRVRDGVALIVSNVVGVGIFTTPAIIAGLVPNPTAMFVLWIVGGLLALAGAMSYAELAKTIPHAGGEYIYLARVYGPAAGFLSGWTSLIAGFSGAVAACSVGLVVYAGEYFPGLASTRLLWSIRFHIFSFGLTPRSLTAAAIILIIAAMHVFSLGKVKVVQNTLALLIAAMILGFAIYGFAFGHGSWAHFKPSAEPFHPMNWMLALIPVMFTYSGWNAAAYVSEELHDVKRTIGPVLFIGTMIVVGLYALLNTLYLYAIPVARMSSAINVGDVAAQALFGVGGNFVTPALIVALLGSISAMTIAGPRVYFAMARDGAFIPAFGRTSKRFGTPALAIVLQAMWSILLVTAGGFEQILLYTGFAVMLSSGVAVAGLFVIRREELRRSKAARLRMLIPAAFVLACAAIVLNGVLRAPQTALVGVALIAAGIPVFLLSRKRRTTAHTSQPCCNEEVEVLAVGE
jgi:APA family basic amino acid/polyamine antiporter